MRSPTRMVGSIDWVGTSFQSATAERKVVTTIIAMPIGLIQFFQIFPPMDALLCSGVPIIFSLRSEPQIRSDWQAGSFSLIAIAASANELAPNGAYCGLTTREVRQNLHCRGDRRGGYRGDWHGSRRVDGGNLGWPDRPKRSEITADHPARWGKAPWGQDPGGGRGALQRHP